MLSRTTDEEESRNDGGEYSPTKEGEGKTKAVIEVEDVSLHYTQKVLNMGTSVLSREAHHGTVFEKDMLFWEKPFSNGHVLSM